MEQNSEISQYVATIFSGHIVVEYKYFSAILTMEYVKILYISNKDMNPNCNKLEWRRTQKYHNMLLLFFAIISLLNISIFLLS